MMILLRDNDYPLNRAFPLPLGATCKAFVNGLVVNGPATGRRAWLLACHSGCSLSHAARHAGCAHCSGLTPGGMISLPGLNLSSYFGPT